MVPGQKPKTLRNDYRLRDVRMRELERASCLNSLFACPKPVSRSDHGSHCAVLCTSLTRFCVDRKDDAQRQKRRGMAIAKFCGSSAHKLQTQEAFMPGSARTSFAIDSTRSNSAPRAGPAGSVGFDFVMFMTRNSGNTSEPMAHGPVWMICMK